MPIHLLPNRREFLGLTVAGAILGRSLAERPGRAADGADPWYAWFSDTHVSADPARKNRDNVMADNLKAVVNGILTEPGRPTGVFVDGDLAFNEGLPADYETFLALLKPLREAKIPIHLALGNHDHRDNFRKALHAEPPPDQAIESKHVSVVNGPNFRALMLDSLQKTNYTPGLLGDDQRGWLAKALDAEPNRPTLVFVHHNPSKDEGALNDQDALFEVLAPRKQVKALVFGHTHRWTDGEREGVRLVNLPAVGYPFAKDQPVGWVRIDPKTDGLTLELRCVGGDRSKDRQKVAIDWRA